MIRLKKKRAKPAEFLSDRVEREMRRSPNFTPPPKLKAEVVVTYKRRRLVLEARWSDLIDFHDGGS